MKIIFLDFDGVLNSSASFVMETRQKKKNQTLTTCPVNQTLDYVCCSNLQYVLDKIPEAKIVISSTWRILFDLEQLKNKLAFYNVDYSRVIGVTPQTFGRNRGREIKMWLDDHPEVTNKVIIDDSYIGGGFTEKEIVKTTWEVGMTLIHALKAIKILGEEGTGDDLPLP